MPDVQAVDEVLSATGPGNILQIKGAGPHRFEVFIRDGATPIVATIQLEVQRPGDDDWNAVEAAYTTFPVFKTGEISGSFDIRLNVTSYTSGDAETTLAE